MIPLTEERRHQNMYGRKYHEWLDIRKRVWNGHINRTSEDRLLKLVRDNIAAGRRSIGWHRRSWSDNIDPI